MSNLLEANTVRYGGLHRKDGGKETLKHWCPCLNGDKLKWSEKDRAIERLEREKDEGLRLSDC